MKPSLLVHSNVSYVCYASDFIGHFCFRCNFREEVVNFLLPCERQTKPRPYAYRPVRSSSEAIPSPVVPKFVEMQGRNNIATVPVATCTYRPRFTAHTKIVLVDGTVDVYQ